MRHPPIFMYHAVDTLADPLKVQVSPRQLRRQLELLRRFGLRGVSMQELLAARSPRRLVGLTFDDGYADFATTVVPILADFGFSATVFMVAGHLGGENDWDPPPRRPLMTRNQLIEVSRAGYEVASHGMTHVRLGGLPPEVVSEEVKTSKAVLEDIVGTQVMGFCYPYGDWSEEAAEAVRDSYEYGCAVLARPSYDRWTLPRFHVGEEDGALRLGAKLALRPLREQMQRRAS